jgi:membrane associated rhomboid family serine protease
MSITLIIIIITVLVSIAALSNEKVYNDLIFYPPSITYDKQWYRFFTCGFIHADYIHLFFNMFALYGFGESIEGAFVSIFYEKGKILYLVLYLTSLFFCLLPTYTKHKTDGYYRSLGASGAVSAVVFVSIMLNPLGGIRLMFIPIDIPAFIFGFIYLAITSYLDKRGGGNINHSAHLWGALYGIAFIIVLAYLLSDYPVLQVFIERIRGYIRL